MRVEIFDQVFALRRHDPEHFDPDCVRGLAQYVDSKMRTLAEETHTVDCSRLAILVALDIAEEYNLLKQELDGEEEIAEEDASIDRYWRPADGPRSQTAPSRKPLTEEARQRIRERRQRHYTKRLYEKQLQASANDESLSPKERQQALLALGRLRGYLRAPKTKR